MKIRQSSMLVSSPLRSILYLVYTAEMCILCFHLASMIPISTAFLKVNRSSLTVISRAIDFRQLFCTRT